MRHNQMWYIFWYGIFFIFVNEFSFILFQMSLYQLLCANLLLLNNYNISLITLEENIRYTVYSETDRNLLSSLSNYYSEIKEVDIYYIYFSQSILYNLVNDVSFISNQNIYVIFFDTKTIPFWVSDSFLFVVLQQKLYIFVGETTLCFFRLLNSNLYAYKLFTIYTITPFEYTSYIVKIQCFCFEELYIQSCECVDLPVLFYLDRLIMYDLLCHYFKEICIEYSILLDL